MSGKAKNLADDLLQGAAEIGAFMGWSRRRVFHAAGQKIIPIFKMGSILCARKSTIIRHIEKKEADVSDQESNIDSALSALIEEKNQQAYARTDKFNIERLARDAEEMKRGVIARLEGEISERQTEINTLKGSAK